MVRREGSLPPILILIAELPHVLRDIVLASVADQPEMAVVGVVGREACIQAEVRRTGATVVIIDAAVWRRESGRAPLARPGAREPSVLALSGDGREAFLEVALGEISPQCLVHAIRQLPTARFND